MLASTATDVRGVQALAAAHGLPCRVEILGMGSEAERSHYRALKAEHDWQNLPMVFLDGRFIGGEPELADTLGGRNAGEPQAAAVARVLGYGGLLPFFALALATLLGLDVAGIDTRSWLAAYAATILSFVGAVHWGVALVQSALPARRTCLAASVVPALVAWVALGLPAPVDLWVFVAAFVGWYAWERVATWDVFPRWYRQLRTALTTGVALPLAAIAIWV
ncbi:MAG: DUF3429 domain-containing protein [Pseudomonadota bacterium]